MVKICTKCNIEKSIDLFSKDKSKADGYYCSCKDCSRKKDKLSRLGNLETRRAKDREYHSRNKDNRNSTRREHYKKTYIVTRTYRTKEYRKQYQKDYYHKYKEENIKYNIEYSKKRRKEDPLFKLSLNLRGRLNKAVRGEYKKGSAVNDLGCSIKEFKAHLESLFQPGMNWDNYGRTGWHIDHIKPLSIFDLSNPAEFKKAVHYANLQPLWAKDNLAKHNKYNE